MGAVTRKMTRRLVAAGGLGGDGSDRKTASYELVFWKRGGQIRRGSVQLMQAYFAGLVMVVHFLRFFFDFLDDFRPIASLHPGSHTCDVACVGAVISKK